MRCAETLTRSLREKLWIVAGNYFLTLSPHDMDFRGVQNIRCHVWAEISITALSCIAEEPREYRSTSWRSEAEHPENFDRGPLCQQLTFGGLSRR